MIMEKPQLFLLHFAGGNCYSFHFMTPWLREFEAITIELPGRGRRMDEKLLYEFSQAADDVFAQIVQRLRPGPFVIYGHSMGAYLALRVAGLLEKSGRSPACLVVGGNAGPGIRHGRDLHPLDTETFIVELLKLGGVSQELVGDRELFSFFEPSLRADFTIAERNQLDDEAPIASPLYALMGTGEEEHDNIGNWQRYTRGSFRYEILEGDHFFIHRHPSRIADIIGRFYKACLEGGHLLKTSNELQ